MQSVKIMIAGSFKLFPDLIAVFTRYVTDLFPVLLDFFHKGSSGFKILIILIFLSNFYKFLLFFKVLVLFFFQAFIIGVLISVKLSYTLFECAPGLFIFLPWHFTRLEELISKFLDLPDLLLPLVVRIVLSARQYYNFSYDLFLNRQVSLILIIQLVIIFLP